MKMKIISLQILSLMIPILITTAVSAQLAPQALSLQGRLLDSQGQPIEAAAVTFSIQVRSPGGEDCVLYEETHTLNMSESGGLFSLAIGTGSRAGSAFEDTSTLTQIFANSDTPLSGLTCTSGTSYTPNTGHKRKIKIAFDDGTGTQTFSQAMDVYAMPYALYADSLQGKTAVDFIQKNQSSAVLTQANLESVFQSTSYVTELIALINGTSTQFTRSSTNGASRVPVLATAPSTPAAGNLWFDSSSNLLKYYDGSSVQSLAAAAGASVSNVSSANSYISVANGSTTPQLTLNVGTSTNTVAAGNDSRITGAFQTSTTLGGDLGGTLPNPTVTKLQTKAVSSTTPTNASQVLKYDGSSQWAPSYLNISDLRSTVGPGYAQFFPTNCTSAQTLMYSSPSDVMTCTNISIASGGVSGLGTAAALNVGTASNNIVQLDGTAKLPAVDGSQLTNLPGAPFPLLSSAAGSAAAPAFSFSGDTDNGMFKAGTNQLGLSTSGVERMRFDASGNIGLGTAAPIAPFHLMRASGNADAIITAEAGNAELLLTGSSGSFYPGVAMAHVGGALQFTKVTNGSPSSYPWISANGATGLYSFTAITGSSAELKLSLQRGNGLSAVTSGTQIARISFDGYNGTGYSNSAAAIQGVAAQTFTPSYNGAHLLFLTTSNGTATPIERMRLDQTGNLGIGTTTPAALLHIYGSVGSESILLENSAGTNTGPKIKLFHGGSGGIQYHIASTGTGDSEGAGKFTIRDFDAGMTRLAIDSGGNVGIGTVNPMVKLELADSNPTTSAILIPRATTFTGTPVNGMIRYHSGSNLFEFRQNGTWVNFTTVSDGRVKTNIEPVENGLAIVNQLRPVFFDWDSHSPRTQAFDKKHQVGFVAQEVERVLPEVVTKGEDSYRTMNYGNIVAVAVAAVKELDQKSIAQADQLHSHLNEINNLKKDNEALRADAETKEREILTLKSRLERLESKLSEMTAERR